MQRMLKGTQLEHMHRILRESTAAGIWNHTFFFFGFPGESLDDAQQTVNFLYQNKYHVNSAGFGNFLLELDAPVLTVRLGPGCGERLVLTMRRYANTPTARHPWQ